MEQLLVSRLEQFFILEKTEKMTARPLKIGNLELKSPVVMAPMAGVTDYPMRKMIRRFGDELIFTEMLQAASLVHAHRRTEKMAVCTPQERPAAVQLLGADPAKMAEAARIAEAQGTVALIDINMGCPMVKITKCGYGAALMQEEETAQKIVSAVVKAVSVPVSVKFRLGWDEDSRYFLDFGKRMQDAGAAAVTLHARTRAQFYSGAADWNAVRQLKESLSIPVIGNGDVYAPEDAARMLAETGADGVMTARGALGRPWFPAACTAYLEGRPAPVVPPLVSVVTDHWHELEKYYGKKAFFIARKHIAWYSQGMKDSSVFRDRVNNTREIPELLDLIHGFFTDAV